MEVYAFIGKTGTGKSYNALSVASKYGIRYIIDDAILIKDNKVICGRSAKTEDTKIASVKSAIFLNEDKKTDMKKVIKIEKPEKILLLGTSDDMVEKIASNLELGEIFQKIYIEEIATKENIEIARKSRMEEGKHVVPVPTFEIKEQFSGYFIDPLRIFNKIKTEEEHSDRTIIRPTYSYLGKFIISERVLNSLVYVATRRFQEITKVFKGVTTKYVDGIKIEVDIEIKYGTNIPILSNKLRNEIIKEIDTATAINIFGIDINIKSISK